MQGSDAGAEDVGSGAWGSEGWPQEISETGTMPLMAQPPRLAPACLLPNPDERPRPQTGSLSTSAACAYLSFI
jgi:hypothetical protein